MYLYSFEGYLLYIFTKARAIFLRFHNNVMEQALGMYTIRLGDTGIEAVTAK